MDYDSAKYLVEQVGRAEKITIGEQEFVARPAQTVVSVPPAEPTAETHSVSGLDSLLGYLDANRDALVLEDHVILADYNTVRLLGRLQGRQRVREEPVRAIYPSWTDPDWMLLEEFVLWLQYAFVHGGDRDSLLKSLRRIGVGQKSEVEDDGTRQKVHVQVGVDLLERAELPSLLTLAPYRTFSEVSQPYSPFAFRIREGRDGGVEATLRCADGGQWKVVATQDVAEWLSQGLAGRQVEIPVLV